ncbi:MAG TPA: hypothetical protein VLX92_25120 [Kofleriaceae bacterium]|nr:hypothetical protein [Kofleriaceae bacterium]
MATPCCPRPDCNSNAFEVHEFKPSSSNFRMQSVQCARCGTVVGVMDYYNIGSLLGQIAKKLGITLK